MIFAMSLFSRKVWNKVDFGNIFGSQSGEIWMKNRVRKHVVLKHQIFSVFSSMLNPFWDAKIYQTSIFFDKTEFRRRPLKRYCFRAAFWMDFATLGTGFW